MSDSAAGLRRVEGVAPGRLDVLGGVADYSGSLVLQMPLSLVTRVVIEERGGQFREPGEVARIRGEDLGFTLHEFARHEVVATVFEHRGERPGRDFGMKLQTEHAFANLKGLVFAGGATCEVHGTLREVEGLSYAEAAEIRHKISSMAGK